MPVTPITNIEEFRAIINGGVPVVIDFWAPWCGPCRAISPVLDKISDKVSGVGFYKVDIDEVPNIAEEVGIRVVPTFMLFKDGNKIKELQGADPKGLETLVTQAA